jgi:pimeloyl-ACP methyl ester carboxylesterase
MQDTALRFRLDGRRKSTGRHDRAFLDNGSRAARLPPERVVLVHCTASSARQWRTLSEQLGDFTPLPLDLLGHGRQGGWHGARPLRLSDEAQVIRNACPDGPPFHLVGHSYGGGVALKFALENPQRLLSLTLIEPSCFHVLKEAKGEAHLLDEVRAVADAVNRGVICGDYCSGMKTFIDYWSGAGSWNALTDEKRAQLAGLAAHVAHHFWSLVEEETPLAHYAAVAVPTLILCGTRSPVPSRAITRLLAETLPRAKHRTMRNVGHMSPITHPGDVNPLVLDHVLMNGASARSRRALAAADF